MSAPAESAVRLRGATRLAGPAMLAAGVWAATGRLTIEGLDATTRLGLPASPWWFVLAFAVACLSPALRARPLLALAALLPVLPWLPIPWPPIVLIWTGRAAWVPVGLAAMAAVLLSLRGRDYRRAQSPRGAAAAAGILTLLALVATATSLSPRLPSGDEPHYLMITQSLLRDGDLRIENNHARGDMAPYLSADVRPHFIQPGANGAIYSIHAPGVPVIVLPAVAMFGYRGAQAVIVLMATLAGVLVWTIAWMASRDRAAAWFAWAAIVGSATFLVQGVTIFPDGPGACVVAGTLAVLWYLERHQARLDPWLVAVSAALSLLPWMHSRFAVIAVGLGVTVIFWILQRTSTTPGVRWRATAAFVAIPLVSAVAWFLFFAVLYGSPSPSAPYGPNPEMNAAYIPGGVAGLLFDQQFGLLIATPVLAAAFVGLRTRGHAVLRLLVWWPFAAGAAYLAASATYWMWWAGVPAPPARLATAILPVFAAPLALAFVTAPAIARLALLLLLTLSLATTGALLGVDHGVLAWNTRDGQSLLLGWLETSVDLARGWPSFFWELIPGEVSSEINFAQHVAAWLIVGGITALVLWSRRTDDLRLQTAAPLVVPVALMVAVQAGWAITGSRGLDASRAQMTLLAEPAERALRVTPGRVAWTDRARTSMTMRLIDRGRRVPDAVLTAVALPPGTYTFDVASRRPIGGELTATIGRAGPSLATFALLPRTRQSVTLELPAGAARLTLGIDQTLRDSIETLDMRPSAAPSAAPTARAALRAPAATVYFLDDDVFVEADAFWVRGERASEAVVTTVSATGDVTLIVTNGPAANTVTVTAGDESQVLTMAGGEVARVPVRGRAPGGAELSIASSQGFRPSDDGASGDDRYLGVRVTVE